MRHVFVAGMALGTAFFVFACRDAQPFPESQLDPRLSGGGNTVFDNSSKAFGSPFPAMSAHNLHVHEMGDERFGATFVTAPAPVNSGLGPIYNNVSCSSCHHNDGIGVPTTGGAESALLIRLSLPGVDPHGGPAPVPGYGTQFQDKAIYGVKPEGRVIISYATQPDSFPDGEQFALNAPSYTLTNLYAPISGSYMTSPRLAPPVFGLGMLEAIPEQEILSHADPLDVNGDGIRGRPNYVWDPVSQSTRLGRFGWKANTFSILAQVAGAYNQDMGVTSRVQPVESSQGQPQYDGRHDDPELADSVLNAVTFYVQSLAVPARRNTAAPSVMRGEKLFTQAGCANCHVTTMTTGVNEAFPQISNQTIHPYTDLLLHDMGPGLADNRPDFLAGGQDWRTAPLWGIGLFATVNYPAYYLHDGRARTLIEAIMWHGGEAEHAKEYFRQMPPADRSAVLNFLGSL